MRWHGESHAFPGLLQNINKVNTTQDALQIDKAVLRIVCLLAQSMGYGVG